MTKGTYTYFDDDVPHTEHSSFEFAVAFVNSFNSLREKDVQGTVWHPLWKIQLPKERLVKEIVRIAKLNPKATLANKYRHGETQ
jgi:hypothetical protein